MNDELEAGESDPPPHPPRRGAAAFAALAILLALVALAVAGWSTWRLHGFTRAEQATRAHDTATIATLKSQLAAGDHQAQVGTERIADLSSGLDGLRSDQQGLARRIANLETGFTTLSGQQQSGRDTLLLNDAEMLLRTAQQRYELFHDSDGALRAYQQAIAVLAQVQNPAFAPVRASATTERDALAAAAPPSRQAALDTLSGLRSAVPSLPLATTVTTPASPAAPDKPGFWSRVGHSLGGIVKISRDDARRAPGDERFARQALSLDLAQAQEALLAFDESTFRAALQRADAALTAQFDVHDGAVQAARAKLTALLSQPQGSGQPPTLGGALAQLQSVRASLAPAPAATRAAPATAASSGAVP